VDEGEREVVTPVELTEEAEEAGDVGGAVLVESVEADEGVEHEELGPERREGPVQSAPVGLEVETEAGCGDDVKVEAVERESSVCAELSDAVAELVGRVLGEIDEGGARGVDLEATEAGGGGSDG
jgi:hypothetical protein